MKHFMRYVSARLEEQVRDEAYRYFVSESLRGIPQSKYFTKDYYAILKELTKEPDKRTAEEIVSDVAKTAGVKIV